MPNSPHEAQRWSLPIQMILRPRYWNWTNAGRLCSKKPTTPGFGSHAAATHGKWSPLQLEIGVKRHVSGCGRPFQKGIATGNTSRISGRLTPQCFPRNHISPWGKRWEKPRVLERWNNTLRQRLARFVRMTWSFSKSATMHETCLLLFLHCYNRERAILFK
ncbi:MAG TPA: IS1 family transposase [Ktedonobacteraceae bacterium]